VAEANPHRSMSDAAAKGVVPERDPQERHTEGEIKAMTVAGEPRARRPGPRRPLGSPVGPDEVRRALLDAAAVLFARRGVDAVSLRDIAAEADVHLALIGRYMSDRDDLVHAVFGDLSGQLARTVLENPSWRLPEALPGSLRSSRGRCRGHH